MRSVAIAGVTPGSGGVTSGNSQTAVCGGTPASQRATEATGSPKPLPKGRNKRDSLRPHCSCRRVCCSSVRPCARRVWLLPISRRFAVDSWHSWSVCWGRVTRLGPHAPPLSRLHPLLLCRVRPFQLLDPSRHGHSPARKAGAMAEAKFIWLCIERVHSPPACRLLAWAHHSWQD